MGGRAHHHLPLEGESESPTFGEQAAETVSPYIMLMKQTWYSWTRGHYVVKPTCVSDPSNRYDGITVGCLHLLAGCTRSRMNGDGTLDLGQVCV